MRKIDEWINSKSCWNKAGVYEQVFVLLGHDKAGANTIRAWIEERIRLKLNNREDSQIQEAEQIAAQWNRY